MMGHYVTIAAPKDGQRFLRVPAGCSSEYWTTSRCQYLAIQGYSAGFLTTAKVVLRTVPSGNVVDMFVIYIYMANYNKIYIYIANYGNMVYLGQITPIVDDESYPQMQLFTFPAWNYDSLSWSFLKIYSCPSIDFHREGNWVYPVVLYASFPLQSFCMLPKSGAVAS